MGAKAMWSLAPTVDGCSSIKNKKNYSENGKGSQHGANLVSRGPWDRGAAPRKDGVFPLGEFLLHEIGIVIEEKLH